MYLNGVKNFIITFLIILAVYQTERLWFEDFSNRSLFYSVFGNSSSKAETNTGYTMESILISKGNNQFAKLSNGIYDDNSKAVFDDAVSKTVLKDNFKGEIQIDANELLGGKCIIYNYDCMLEREILKGMFDVKKNVYSKMDYFDRIIIIPSMNLPQNIRVIIENSEKGIGWLFELENSDTVSAVYNAAEAFSASDTSQLYYISSKQNGFELFERNEFIPRWQGSGIEYPSVVMTNPMEKDSGVLLTTIEKYIDGFFENPAVKWNTTINDVYTYSDENTVVKYYTTGVLEYTSYATSKSIISADFTQNYSAALNFMAEDTNITNEYYLSSYTTDDQDAVFYFNYKINNLPITLTSGLKEKTGMQSMIEVSVENGRVTKYKKLVYNFETDEENKLIIDTDFLEAVDKNSAYVQNAEGEEKNGKISGISLAYAVEADGEPIEVSWFINTDGNVFRQNANREE